MIIMRIASISLALCLLGCTSTTTKSTVKTDPLQYNFREFTITDEEWVGKTTFADVEGKRYKKQYEEKMAGMRALYAGLIEAIRKSGRDHTYLKAMEEQQRDFERFMIAYGDKSRYGYMRSAYYHYLGSMVDLIDLRIKHIKIRMNQLK